MEQQQGVPLPPGPNDPPTEAPPGPILLTPEQYANAISTAIATALQQLPMSQNISTTMLGTTAPIKPRDIGYLDPNPELDAVETKDDKTIYHNVYSFTARLKVKSTSSSAEAAAQIRRTVDACLLGRANTWYTSELNDITRSGLRNDPNGVDLWCTALEARFREAPGKALLRLNSLRYTVRDAAKHKDPEDYVQQIVVLGKNAGTAPSEYAQVLLAYEHLDGELRQTLPVVTERTTISEFIQYISAQKNNWFDVHGKASYFRNELKSDQPRTSDGRYSQRPSGPYRGLRYPGQGYYQAQQTESSTNRYAQPNRYSHPMGNAYKSDKPPIKQEAIEGRETTPRQHYGSTSRVQPGYLRRDDRKPQTYPQRPGRPRNYIAEASSADRSDDYQAYEDSFYQQTSFQDDGYYQDMENEANAEDSYYTGQPETEEVDTVEAHFGTNKALPKSKPSACKICKAKFESGNKLYTHLAAKSCKRPSSVAPLPMKGSNHQAASSGPHQPSSPLITMRPHNKAESIVTNTGHQVIRSNASDAPSKAGYAFKGWRYATAQASSSPDCNTSFSVCIDTGCTMSLVDREFLKRHYPQSKVMTMASPMEVRGIGATSHSANQYALIDLYLLGKDKRVAHLKREVHLVDSLKANLLVGIDILAPEGITVDLASQKALIRSCQDIEVPLSVETRSHTVRRTVFSQKRTVIPAHSLKVLSVHGAKSIPFDFPKDRDLLFEPSAVSRVSVFTHIVDCNMNAVYVQNNSDEEVILQPNTKVGEVVEYEADGCFMANPEDLQLAAKPPKRGTSWAKRAWKAVLGASMVSAAYSGSAQAPSNNSQEVRLENGITVYGDQTTIPQLSAVAMTYPGLWTDHGSTARVPESEYMDIPLVDNWRDIYKPGQARVYPLGQKDRQVIDGAFDKLHSQGRMEWTAESTPFSFPCFVVWKDLGEGQRKGRVVVDIRALNKITMPDAYPVLSQADILAAVSGANYITTVDCSSFFYQWLVNPAHRHRLTVASHRGQETFRVAVMGYRNSPAYVQRMIDRILRPCRAFARAYVDDLVIFSNTLEEHLKHMNEVFKILSEFNICLSPKKSFLGYPSVALLGQRVDAFGLATAAEKLAAITKLDFPRTLRQLEHYLGLTGYLRQYIPFYAGIIRPLQLRKTYLNKILRGDGSDTAERLSGTNGRKRVASRLGITVPTPSELKAFYHLQKLFSRPSILVHFSPQRQLYIDMDSSKEGGHGAYAYHTAQDENITKPALTSSLTDTFSAKHTARAHPPKQKSIQPILFLSRELTVAEQKYWPTELEVAGLVWTVRKLRHMIETSELPVIVYTDHSSTCQIVRQSSLNTASVEKLNLRLIRASEYLQRFNLDVRHRAGRTNVIPDALSRLPRLPVVDDCKQHLIDRAGHSPSDMICSYEKVQDNVSAYPVSLVQMSSDFKTRLAQAYQDDPRCIRIKDMIEKNLRLGHNAAALPYRIIRGSIYFKDPEQGLRLVVPQALVGEVFRLAHDEIGHQGYARTHERLTEGLYISNLSKQLHEYLRHCPECQLNQTPRHRPYGAMQPIISPPRPFHTITIDFVLGLPKSIPDGHDCVMSVTCKFSKAITLIPGKVTWGGREWAIHLLDIMALLLWGLPRAILSDRDRRFVGQLWQGIFKALHVDLLYSTSYHPQTDGMSERTNQTVEIALRYYLATLEQLAHWPAVLPRLSQALSNSTSFATGRTPTEVLFGFRTREALDFLREETSSPIDATLVNTKARTRTPVLSEYIHRVHDLYTQAYPMVTRSQRQRLRSREIAELTQLRQPTQPSQSTQALNTPSPRHHLLGQLRYGDNREQNSTLARVLEYRPAHIDAKDAISFAVRTMKQHYDNRHQPRYFRVGDFVNLRLHRGYHVPALRDHHKVRQQFVGPFKVIERIGKLAYRLELPPVMKIHPIISIAHLEPATIASEDPFNRTRPQQDHPLPVTTDGEYEVEKLLRKRIVRRGRGYSTEYLVRYLGYGPEHDEWLNLKDLGNAAELVQEFENASESDETAEEVLA